MYMRMFIRPGFEFFHRQLGEMAEIKTRVNKTLPSVFNKVQKRTFPESIVLGRAPLLMELEFNEP